MNEENEKKELIGKRSKLFRKLKNLSDILRRKNKIVSYIQMARILYRNACVKLKPMFILMD
jgi:hypothetical protein